MITRGDPPITQIHDSINRSDQPITHDHDSFTRIDPLITHDHDSITRGEARDIVAHGEGMKQHVGFTAALKALPDRSGEIVSLLIVGNAFNTKIVKSLGILPTRRRYELICVVPLAYGTATLLECLLAGALGRSAGRVPVVDS